MITCDYLILGAGFAGIGLKYKLSGNAVLVDHNPFQYKIGESQTPYLVNADPGLFSLIPKIMKMKSYTKKLGTIFCDSYHGKYASNNPAPLGALSAWHCEREELERLLVKELGIEIRTESIVDINLSKNLVTTDRNTYRFKKYLLDCSGPAMVIANKLNLVSPLGQFEGMKAQWGYWSVDQIREDRDSWANWTVLNKIGPDSWIWQIPIYNSSILSMGLLHRGEQFSDENFIEYAQKHSAACYELTSIFRNPAKALKPYMTKIHYRNHYSKMSQKCAGKNWILVGDAYCFADPVYSVGSGVAMLEALTIADILNKNKGSFDYAWYERNCSALLKTVVDGIDTWYSGSAFNKRINREVNKTILQGGFARYFEPSRITERAKNLQVENVQPFLPSIDRFSKVLVESGIKVYFLDKSAFQKQKNSLSIIHGEKNIPVKNAAVRNVFENHIIGKKLSFGDFYLIVDKNLRTIKDKTLFWKLIRFIEMIGLNRLDAERLYYFHPQLFENAKSGLKLGCQNNFLVLKSSKSADFFERLKGRVFSGKDLIQLDIKTSSPADRVKKDLERFLKKFGRLNTFGQNVWLSGQD